MESIFVHYGTVALAVAINSVSVGLGQGIATSSALEAVNRQPQAKSDIQTIAIMGMALIETAAIMGVSIAIILLMASQSLAQNWYGSLAELGIALAICLSGLTIGIISALPTKSACLSVARQPFASKTILRFMLISQSIIQTPIIFGFIIAMFIKAQAPFITTLSESLRLIASGLSIGLGSIGPAIGLGLFAQTACASLGINRAAYGKLIPFTFISQAIIETPVIFALVIALILISSSTQGGSLVEGIALLSSALCVGLGTIGAGISSGRTAAAACVQITNDPAHYSLFSKMSMFAQGIIDTCAIYALLIAFVLIFLR